MEADVLASENCHDYCYTSADHENAVLRNEIKSLKAAYKKLENQLSDREKKYQSMIDMLTIDKNENRTDSRLQTLIQDLFNKPLYSDLEILLNGKHRIFAHRLVLASKSDEWGVNHIGEVDQLDFSDLRYEVAYALVKWIYTDIINTKLDDDIIIQLLQVSLRFQLEQLHIRCQNILASRITFSNCRKYYEISEEAEHLRDCCLKFFSQFKARNKEFNEQLPPGKNCVQLEDVDDRFLEISCIHLDLVSTGNQDSKTVNNVPDNQVHLESNKLPEEVKLANQVEPVSRTVFESASKDSLSANQTGPLNNLSANQTIPLSSNHTRLSVSPINQLGPLKKFSDQTVPGIPTLSNQVVHSNLASNQNSSLSEKQLNQTFEHQFTSIDLQLKDRQLNLVLSNNQVSSVNQLPGITTQSNQVEHSNLPSLSNTEPVILHFPDSQSELYRQLTSTRTPQCEFSMLDQPGLSNQSTGLNQTGLSNSLATFNQELLSPSDTFIQGLPNQRTSSGQTNQSATINQGLLDQTEVIRQSVLLIQRKPNQAIQNQVKSVTQTINHHGGIPLHQTIGGIQPHLLCETIPQAHLNTSNPDYAATTNQKQLQHQLPVLCQNIPQAMPAIPQAQPTIPQALPVMSQAPPAIPEALPVPQATPTIPQAPTTTLNPDYTTSLNQDQFTTLNQSRPQNLPMRHFAGSLKYLTIPGQATSVTSPTNQPSLHNHLISHQTSPGLLTQNQTNSQDQLLHQNPLSSDRLNQPRPQHLLATQSQMNSASLLIPQNLTNSASELIPQNNNSTPPYFKVINQATNVVKVKRFKCEICNAWFVSNKNLRNHKKIHLGIKPYKCDVCGKCFRQASTLLCHNRTHSGEKPYVCNTCGKFFRQKIHLRQHLKTHTGEKNYKCDFCEMRFIESVSMRVHMRTHTKEKPFKCLICPLEFTRKQSLKTHVMKHSGIKQFQCHTCDKQFYKEASLKIHMFTHETEKPFKCEECHKTFATNNALKKHKNSHKNVKKFQCAHCPKVFSRKEQLKEHVTTHSDERPYKCQFCDRLFCVKSALTRHTRVTHKDRTTHIDSGELSVP